MADPRVLHIITHSACRATVNVLAVKTLSNITWLSTNKSYGVTIRWNCLEDTILTNGHTVGLFNNLLIFYYLPLSAFHCWRLRRCERHAARVVCAFTVKPEQGASLFIIIENTCQMPVTSKIKQATLAATTDKLGTSQSLKIKMHQKYLFEK